MQEFIYSVTNTFEGAIFVDQTTADTVQVGQYISELFPNLGPKEIEDAQAQYAGLGSNISQAVAIIGEGEHPVKK
jgi:cholinesterase